MTTVTGDEYVVLLDEDGNSIGRQKKSTVHHDHTPLHLAFSCYAFDRVGRLLMTRRAKTKSTFPGLWTNTCCGHPAPGEELADAVHRRAAYEIGVRLHDLTLVLPHFRYRAVMDGIVENEICPVFIARCDEDPLPRTDEVDDFSWRDWTQYVAAISSDHGISPWSKLQVQELVDGGHVDRFLSGIASNSDSTQEYPCR